MSGPLSTLNYLPKPSKPAQPKGTRTSRNVVGFLVVAVTLFFVAGTVPMARTELYVDAITGSTVRKTTILHLLKTTEYTPSALQRRLEQSRIPWTAHWTFTSGNDRWLISGSDCELGTMPPIGRFASYLNFYVRGASDAEVSALVQTLQNGSPDQRTAAAAEVESRIDAAMDRAAVAPIATPTE